MKSTVVVNTIRSRVENLDASVASIINRKLSFQVPGYHFRKNKNWDGYIRFFNRPGNVFPTGLLPIVVNYLREYEVEFCIQDNRHNPTIEITQDIYDLNGKVLREYQENTVNTTLSNYVGGIPFMRGVINIATNGGKTVIAESIIKALFPQLSSDKKLLFLTHSKEIAYQTKASFAEDLDIEAGIIGDGEWEEKPVTIALIPTLYSSKSSKVTQKKQMYKNLRKATIALIGDEVHHASSDSWYTVMNDFTGANIRLGLTGTIGDDKIREHKLYSTTGTILTKISNSFLIEQKFSAVPVCYYMEVNNQDLDDLDYQDAYKQGIVCNNYRNELIKKIILKEIKEDNTVLVLVERTEHGEIIESLVKKAGVQSVRFTHGQRTTDFRKKVLSDLKSGSLKVLIATSILDEGVSVDNINSIIYARGLKASRKILQGIGRGLRKKKDDSELHFYDFLDYTNIYLTEHTLERYTIMKNEGFKIVKLLDTDL